MSKHIWLIMVAILTFGLAFVIYVNIYQLHWWQSLFYSLAVFALDIKTPGELLVSPIPQYWQWIYLAGILAFSVMSATVISLYLKLFKNENDRLKVLKKGNYILVIGLGDSNRAYIDSVLKADKFKDRKESRDILIIEKDKENPYISQYRQNKKGKVVVLIGDASKKSVLEDLALNDKKPIVISTDNDMTNLEIATQILEINKNVKLFIHIEDRNLRHFHKENGILSGSSIKVYSYQEEAARELFEKYDVDGEGTDVIHSDTPYAIAVVGDTTLAYEVVAQASIMGQLPHANELTIYCIDKEPHLFIERITLQFPEIGEVPNVKLEPVSMDVDTKAFYTDALWKTSMTNIIICFDNDQKNLDVASNLTNLTFLDKVVDGNMQTNILIAMFNGYTLSSKIKNNNEMFKHLHVFGGIREINDEKYIIGGKRDKQAIETHYIYTYVEPISKEYESLVFLKTDERGWSGLSYFKKESNRAVADHMKMKLKYLGLQIQQPSDEKSIESLYAENKKLFYAKINGRVILARMEHNRWNAFHYLHGFKSIEFVSKEEKENFKYIHEAKKVHMCLVEFDEFKKKSDELLQLGYKEGKFEGYDFMINEYIPLILAKAGYKIYQDVTLGITGHRSGISDEVYTKLFGYIKNMIEKESISIKTIISSLADGADRVVAKHMLEEYNAKLIVSLPFEQYEYQKDFSEDSQEEFQSFLSKSDRVYTISSLDAISKDEAYLKAGEYVVDNCDILIAIWDGEDAKGVGGTGDIVAYAEQCKKPILYINTASLNIKYMNFKGV